MKLLKASCSALADIPISIWYLTFYCNPAIKLAVVNKIFIKGLSESAALYAASTEKYLHTEEPYEGDFEAWTKKEIVEVKGGGGYDVTSLSNVCMSHLIHFLSMPFTAIREIYVPIKTSLIRDLGGD